MKVAILGDTGMLGGMLKAELKAQGKMWCSLCDKVKPLAEFDDDSNHYCRACLTGITLATAEERDEREE